MPTVKETFDLMPTTFKAASSAGVTTDHFSTRSR